MDLIQTVVLALLISFALWLYAIIHTKFSHQNSSKLPPGPKPFPIIGNIFELGRDPHKSLAKFSKIYGPLMTLKLGNMPTLVVSSPETAKLLLLKYDQYFSSRPTLDSLRPLDHHKFSVAWMPSGNQWRKLRKICKEQMFYVQRLAAIQSLRKEKLQQLWNYLNESCINAEMVDPQRIFQKNKIYFEKCFKVFDEIINQRMQERELTGDSTSKRDMLEALLDLKQEKEIEFSFDDIKHLLLDLFVAGTDTTSITVEWALTEPMSNPEQMLKVQNELGNVIGYIDQVEESEISKFPYLRAAIKETFKLHPAAPLSVPHRATKDVEINNYLVPKDTQVLVNVWAIGRDSTVWSEPDLFMPERFLEQEIDFYGKSFELLPFGGGRRICLGLPLAYRTVHLIVATFVHNFNWKLHGEIKPGEIDMTEKFGLTLQKAKPLKAVPFKVM